jgi:phage terminase small subunit
MAKKKKKQMAVKSGKRRGRPSKADKEAQEIAESGLNFRQQLFVDELLTDEKLNATQAAIRAGYSKKTAGSQAFDLLKKPEIAKALNRAIKERRDRLKMDADETLREIDRVARSDVLNYLSFGADGVVLRDSDELIEGEARAISEVSSTFSSDGRLQIKFKLHDKLKALDLKAKHLKLYEENPINVNLTWSGMLAEVEEAKRLRESKLNEPEPTNDEDDD